MKRYESQPYGLIKAEGGTLFVAHASDDLFNQMQAEIEAGEAELVPYDG